MAEEVSFKVIVKTMDVEPSDIPEWRSIYRECNLIRVTIGSGADSLLRANYVGDIGNYYSAFFGLSTGIERLAKLILFASYVIDHKGELANNKIIKSYGHNLKGLLDEVENIASKHKLKLQYARPRDNISNAIVDCLHSFANKGRYGNLDFLLNSNFDIKDEPMNKWWQEVAEPILGKHFQDKEIKEKMQNEIECRMKEYEGAAVFVHYIDETSGKINNLRNSFERAVQTEAVQKYGRYYALRIVRWVAEVFYIISMRWGHGDKDTPLYPILFGHHEHFLLFMNSDAELEPKRKCP